MSEPTVTTTTKLPASCYIFIHATPGSRVGLVMRDVSGFLITKIDRCDMSDEEVRELVETLNKNLRVPADVAARMYQAAITAPHCRQPRLAPCFAS